MFLRYCGAKLREDAERYAARAYLTDAVRILTENTRRFAGGRQLTKRWTEIVDRKMNSGRSGDEIAAEVIARGAIKVIKETVNRKQDGLPDGYCPHPA